MADLAKYVVKLEAETAAYQRELNKATQKLQRFHKKQVISLDSIKKGFAGLATAAGGLAIAGGAIFVKMARDLDNVSKAARTANIGAETFQEWEFAATQSGIAVAEFTAALGRANRRIGLFIADGGGPAAKAFERLNIVVQKSSGEFRSNEAIIRDFVKELENIETQAERTALITQLFGDDARRMALAFGQGEEELRKFEERARALGIVIGEDTLKKAEKFNDEMDVLQRVLQGNLAEKFDKIAPAVLRITSAFVSAAPAIADATEKLLDFLGVSQNAQLSAAQDKLKGINEQIREQERIIAAQGVEFTMFGRVDRDGEAQRLQDARDALVGLQAQAVKGRMEVFNLQRGLLAAGGAGSDGGKAAAAGIQQLTDELTEAEKKAAAVSKWLAENQSRNQIEFDSAIAREAEKMANFDSVVESLKTQEELVRDSYERRRKIILDNTQATSEEQARLLERLEQQTAEQLARLNEGIDEFTLAGRDAVTLLGDIFQDHLFDGFSEGLDGMLKEWVEALARMAIEAQTTKLLENLFRNNGGGSDGGGFWGSIANIFSGARADGGPVSSGRTYLVGERGPELFVPGASGQIIPNGEGMGDQNVFNIDARGASAGVERRIREAVQEAVALSAAQRRDAKRRGR